jgi:putative spermidine/putrescine transport system ATP-binding protein/putrescine transport system ATP-binding protein
LTKAFGGVPAVRGISFSVAAGEVLSLLGPSGCGKTTTLRMIAGFELPDSGAIHLNGRDVTELRPYERNVGLVFQDYALFPHMTVAENIGYGLKRRGQTGERAAARVEEMLTLVKLGGYGDRHPATLSGGQQQRVALARALAIQPNLLLLDEPLSALDTRLREELRAELRRILSLAGITTIIVTHDQEEAMSLSDQVVIMNAGRIEQQDVPTALYAAPASPFAAEFLGRVNWIRGGLGARRGDGVWEYRTVNGAVLAVAAATPPKDGRVRLGIRPERFEILRSGSVTGDGNLNCHAGTVRYIENLGAEWHCTIDLDSGDQILVIEQQQGRMPADIGAAVKVTFPANAGFFVPESPEG